MHGLRETIVAEVEGIGGRHDDPDVYGGPAGDPGLLGPGSVSWIVHGDLASVALAGTAAIALEMLHPSVAAGVEQQSSYREDPLKRARATLGYVLSTTFGNTEAATRTIDVVRAVHGYVSGTRADGVAYSALDPELLGWVHTSIPWMILRTYERYHQPLTAGERDRYLAEQAVIGRMGGAGRIPVTMDELADYVEMMRPKLAVTVHSRAFLDFLHEVPPAGPALPGPLQRRRQRLEVQAGMSLAPRWARELTQTDVSAAVRRAVIEPYMTASARAVRWAFATPTYARLAKQRAAAGQSLAAAA